MSKSQGPRPTTEQGDGQQEQLVRKPREAGAADTLSRLPLPRLYVLTCQWEWGWFSPSTMWCAGIKTKSPGWGQVLSLLRPLSDPTVNMRLSSLLTLQLHDLSLNISLEKLPNDPCFN